MFAAVIVDLHCPESLKILIVIIILQGPVGMIVTSQKTCVCPLLYVSVLSGHILISISRKRELRTIPLLHKTAQTISAMLGYVPSEEHPQLIYQ